MEMMMSTIRQQLENVIWGYNDPVPFPDGSFGVEMLDLAEKMYELGTVSIDKIAELFEPTVKKMNTQIEGFLFGDNND